MKILALIAIFAVAVSAQNTCPLRCQLPKKTGDCEEVIPRFYFDNEAKKCRGLIYTGCGGNVNRFNTLQLCKNTCLSACTSGSTTTTKSTTKTTTKTTKRTTTGGTKKRLPVRCTLKLDPGNCNKAIPRFYYDSASGKCKSFNYSGCRGNVNNFRSQELCEEICLGA